MGEAVPSLSWFEHMESVAMDGTILIRQVAMGDRTAFDTLYRCYAPHLRGCLYAQLGQPEVAEEACHDVLLVVWQKASQFQHESRLSTWVFGIAARLARKGRTRASTPVTERDYPVEQLAMDDAALALEHQERMQTLSQALTHLPDHLQETLRLRYDRDYTYQEIAHEMGCLSETVKRSGAGGCGTPGTPRSCRAGKQDEKES